MENPIWSSILYLNSAEECGGSGASEGETPCRLSATLIMNQTFDPATREAVRIPFRTSPLSGSSSPNGIAFRCHAKRTACPQPQVPEPFRESAVVWPAENRFCAFDGRLAHGKHPFAARPSRRCAMRPPGPPAAALTSVFARRCPRQLFPSHPSHAPHKLAREPAALTSVPHHPSA